MYDLAAVSLQLPINRKNYLIRGVLGRKVFMLEVLSYHSNQADAT